MLASPLLTSSLVWTPFDAGRPVVSSPFCFGAVVDQARVQVGVWVPSVIWLCTCSTFVRVGYEVCWFPPTDSRIFDVPVGRPRMFNTPILPWVVGVLHTAKLATGSREHGKEHQYPCGPLAYFGGVDLTSVAIPWGIHRSHCPPVPWCRWFA